MKLIGFTGAMGSGKSTAIEYLRATAGQLVINVKFAQPLYDMQEYVYDRISSVYQRPEGFVKDRKLLQWIGTEWGRDTILESLWVDVWKCEVRSALAKYPNAIITCDDVRFDNEAAALRKMGGAVIKIACDRTDQRIDTNSGLVDHKSEAGIDQSLLDFMVANNGSIQDFKSSLHPVFKALLNGERND